MSFSREEANSSTISVQDDQIRRAQLRMQFHGTRRGDFQTIEAFVSEREKERETTMSSPRRVQLKLQFHSTRKGDQDTIESYVKRLKSIANSLAEMDSPVSDPDMVLQLLAGLPSEYLPLQNTIISKCPLPTFEEACSMVYMQEDILLQDHEEQITTDPGVVGQEQSSAFCTVEKFVAVVDTVSTIVAAVGTFPTVVAAVGASRMIIGCAVGAVTGWKIWQAHPRK